MPPDPTGLFSQLWHYIVAVCGGLAIVSLPFMRFRELKRNYDAELREAATQKVMTQNRFEALEKDVKGIREWIGAHKEECKNDHERIREEVENSRHKIEKKVDDNARKGEQDRKDIIERIQKMDHKIERLIGQLEGINMAKKGTAP